MSQNLLSISYILVAPQPPQNPSLSALPQRRGPEPFVSQPWAAIMNPKKINTREPPACQLSHSPCNLHWIYCASEDGTETQLSNTGTWPPLQYQLTVSCASPQLHQQDNCLTAGLAVYDIHCILPTFQTLRKKVSDQKTESDPHQ